VQTAGVSRTIALVGSGEYLEKSREVDEHLLSLAAGCRGADAEPVKVACLPTAAAGDGERVWRDWSRRGVEWFTGLGADAVAVDVVSAETADDPGLAAEVEQADLVYLSGGKPTMLHEVLDGSRAWSAIQVVLDRGGVLAGCSAGAMVQGAKIAGLRGGGETDGFALLPGTMIIPHFDEWPSLISGLVRRVVGRGHTVVGIDGGTAMVRHGDEHRAVGIGGVEVWGPLGHRRFERELLPAGFIDPIA